MRACCVTRLVRCSVCYECNVSRSVCRACIECYVMYHVPCILHSNIYSPPPPAAAVWASLHAVRWSQPTSLRYHIRHRSGRGQRAVLQSRRDMERVIILFMCACN